MSYDAIAKFFTEKFGKKVYSSVVERSYKMVKGTKEKGKSVDERDFVMKRQNKQSKPNKKLVYVRKKAYFEIFTRLLSMTLIIEDESHNRG